ncbi:MAG: MBOAT family O-acyltransferase [Eubacteriales bacterium]|nr:MBOAT family O-acyltransferase [Eubacteriales bacterium]
MGITTLNFFVFLAIGVLLFYRIPKKMQWMSLLILSIFFYVYASRTMSIFIGITCISVYLLSLLIERSDLRYKEELRRIKAGEVEGDKKLIKKQNMNRKRLCIAAAALINVGMLVVLKFYNMIFAEINASFFGGSDRFFPLLSIGLPLGISFYTFQAIGYLVDLYRGKVKAEHNFFKVSLFITFFPQILQGPISRYDQLSPQLYGEHEFDFQNISDGFYLMLWGIFKKMVIADRAGMMCDLVFPNYLNYSGMQFWVALAAYTMQMYGDFSGGIDIIRGAAKMFDIDMVDNFTRPYFSRDIPEFWRRWHITLGTWFKDYLMYPVALSGVAQNVTKSLRKKGKPHLAKVLPSYVACIILWMANGAWHGAGTQYILFGVYHGILTILSMEYHDRLVALGDRLHFNQHCVTWRWFQVLRTMLLVAIGRVIYITPNFHAALVVLKSMVTVPNFWIFFDGSVFDLGLNSANALILVVACLILFGVELAQELGGGMHIRVWMRSQNVLIRWIIAFGLIFTILIFGIYGKGYDAAGFIYMQY